MADCKTMKLERATGRYGVAYVRKVCAQAHVGFDETSSDEDVLAIDGKIALPSVDLRVQVKTTSKYSLKKTDGDINLSVDKAWVDKWRKNKNPAYLILVLVKKNVPEWLTVADGLSTVGGYALWARIDNLSKGTTSLTVKRKKVFTAATIADWNDFVVDGYEDDEEVV